MLSDITKYYEEPLYRNSIALMLGNVSVSFFGLLFWAIAARVTTSSEIGFATAVISVTTLITYISRVGMDAGIVRFLPRTKNKNMLFSTILVFTLLSSMVVTLIFLTFINAFSPALSFLRDGMYLVLFIVYIAMLSINQTQNTTLIAIRKSDLSLLDNLILGFRVPLLLFVGAIGLLGILCSISVATLVSILLGCYMLYRCGISSRLKFDPASLYRITTFSIGNYLSGLASIAPSTIIPILILNTLGSDKNAYFYLAYSIASLLFMIPDTISTSLFVEGSHDLPLKENVLKSIKFAMIILIPTAVFIFFFGDRILMVFNVEYATKSFEMLRFMALASLFGAVNSIYISIKRVQKDIKMINFVSFSTSTLIICFGYLSIINVGLSGIGYVWLASNIIVSVVVMGLVVLQEKWIKVPSFFQPENKRPADDHR